MPVRWARRRPAWPAWPCLAGAAAKCVLARVRACVLACALACALALVLACAAAGGAAAQQPARPDSVSRRDTVTVRADSVARRLDSLAAAALDTSPAAPLRPTSVGPLFIPAIFYAPETGIGGGAGVLYLRTTDPLNAAQRLSTHAANALVTAKGQYVLSVLNDVWTKGNGWRVGFDVSWARFPNRFYGIGSQRVDSGETFTPTSFSGLVSAQRIFGPGVYAGPKLTFDDTRISDVVPGGILAGGASGAGGWRLVTLSWLTSWDRRDQLYWPTHGFLLSTSVGRAFGHLGSTQTFNRVTLDARGYTRLQGDHLLAAQFWTDFTDGAAPFDRLPQLGGQQLLRGYFAGQFRDRHSAVAQLEYRSPGFDWSWEKRLSMVVFVATGGTAREPSRFVIEELHTAGGAGLRFALTPGDRLNFRLDYGVGRSSSAVYITLGESF